MTTKTLIESDLAQFTGSDNWYRHSINRNVLYTDGAQHVAEHGGAYWLLDEIAIIQPYNKAVAAEEFQVWKLAVRPDRTASLTCDDGDGNIVFTKEIEHTDFPLDEITLYFANNVIHLPSEYKNPGGDGPQAHDQCYARAGVLAGAGYRFIWNTLICTNLTLNCFKVNGVSRISVSQRKPGCHGSYMEANRSPLDHVFG